MPFRDSADVPPWLRPHCELLEAMTRRGQNPQALLIHGLPGLARRQLALWFASRLLDVPVERLAHLAHAPVAEEETQADLGHPDLMLIQPLPEKHNISIEQVRDHTGFLRLKSHQGGARVVLIWPAEAMTEAAANSLLKILEEPPAGSAVVLITAAPGLLPPTIVSRCVHLRISPPAPDVALAWLAARDSTADWPALLEFSGGAPFKALALHQQGFGAQIKAYARDLHRLRHRQDTPVAVARRWNSGDLELPLRWLYWQAAHSLRRMATETSPIGAATPGKGHLQNPQKQLTMLASLERLREVEELYRNRTRPTNPDLQLGSILQRWYGEVAGGD